ncbi:MAG: HEPN domain-containing protein [Roseiarcus sp.]|jgi:hypothetical protein
MLRAVAIFDASIVEARNLTALHGYLTQSVRAPYPFDDLLRSQVVYAVSAFDKLLHDLIRVGMVETYVGRRVPTDRYHSESITIQFHGELLAATVPPKEYLFEQEIIRKLGRLSFQDPEKVAEGLSLIWDEKHKWAKVADAMGQKPDDVRTTLKLITGRRNAIVHESDMHPLTNVKTPITTTDCNDITDFLQLCGRTIGNLVT